MNRHEQVKKYQADRRQATDFISSLQLSSMSFLQQLLHVNRFVSALPIDVMYRKRRLQQLIAELTQDIDIIKNELQLLTADCDIQIHGLIVAENIEKLREEKTNAKRTNSKMVRRAHN